MPTLPHSVVNACTAGSLPCVKDTYHDFIRANPAAVPSALHQLALLAIEYNQPEILSFCFSEGLTLEPKSVNDPLVYAACDSSSVEIFRVLLDEGGLDVNKYLELGGDALASACRAGNVELATFLLDRGANPDSDYPAGEYTALIWAIIGHRASLDLLRLLLARGAGLKKTGALIAAAEHGKLEAVELLVGNEDVDLEEVEEYGDWDGRKQDDMGTALYKAAAEGHVQIVEFLLKKGADPGFKDRKGRSVGDVARGRGHGEIVRILREAGGDGKPSSEAGS